ncbi:hypothetical protein T05_9830 [Trichinella murrelli]|uniref:Uncharacterized protein n=1 Tax=Trichinella murrelli TaxID=144512 RepID=A0A0V0UG79_9BILA|nr:hypothetical protein T05_9830 [Trichinella murrelli]
MAHGRDVTERLLPGARIFIQLERRLQHFCTLFAEYLEIKLCAAPLYVHCSSLWKANVGGSQSCVLYNR